MTEENNRSNPIVQLRVKGFKSLGTETPLDVRPLTILAGANSSGKSSFMQPFLMMKQTLEAPYDPGPLLLRGSNVRFVRADQFLRNSDSKLEDLTVSLSLEKPFQMVINTFRYLENAFELAESSYVGRFNMIISNSLSDQEISRSLPKAFDGLKSLYQSFREAQDRDVEWKVIRDRCFLDLALDFHTSMLPIPNSVEFYVAISNIIHVPGIRGNIAHTYPLTPVFGPDFPGTIGDYVAGIIRQWMAHSDDRWDQLSESLGTLGLTRGIFARPVDDTQAELLVVSPINKEFNDGNLVNISDVGLGVSQVLPVLVALLVAQPGQLVYIEQPEIHLHPKAQVALAKVLADAAKRGVRVVAETHSALLLLGIQTLVAKGELDKDLVKLHWFSLQEDGTSKVSSHDLDETGAYGEWPEDFGDVELNAQSAYLDAVDSQELVK